MRAFHYRRALGASCLGGVVFLAACSNDIDTSRQVIARGTLGEEMFGIVCDRVGAQALHEDMTGASFHAICHKDANGHYADKVDQALLPGLVDGLVDKDGKPVSLQQQQTDRLRAIARIEALAHRRADLIAALDATFPDIQVPVVDNKNPDPAQSCKAPAASGMNRLHDELADLLGRFQDLYNDGTIPQSTESLARVMNAFKASPDAQAAYARFDARQGYRPLDLALGAARPVIAYPRLRELANASLSLLSADSNPYDPNPKLDANGKRIPVPGAAYPQFSKLLEVTHNELRDTTPDAPLAPLPAVKADPSERLSIPRPRTNLEFVEALFYASDPAFGGGASRYIVKRDARGYADIFRGTGAAVPAPFVDDGSGQPKVDPLGRFITTDGSVPPTPFFAVGQAFGNRDNFGRAVGAQGQLFYNYIDTSHTFTAQLLSDLKPLANPDPAAKHETLMYAMSGAYVLMGARDGSPKSTRKYSPDPDAADNYRLTHNGQDPPAGLSTTPVTVPYNAYRTDQSPMLDMVYATGQVLGRPSTDAVLQLTRTLFTKNQPDLARVIGDGLYAKQIADKHPEAKLPAKSVLWDEMLDVVVQIAQAGLLEDVLRAVAADDSKNLGTIFSSYMNYNDRISYDRANLNGPAFNFNTNNTNEMKTPVDRSKPDTGANRSAMQRFLQTIHDTNGVTVCNKEGAVLHTQMSVLILTNPDLCGSDSTTDGSVANANTNCTGSIPLISNNPRPFHECEVFKLENVAKFYLDSMIGKASLYFRPGLIRNGLGGLGKATIQVMEDSSGIGTAAGNGNTNALGVGFWDNTGDAIGSLSCDPLKDTKGNSFTGCGHPKPTWLNRLVFFDLKNDSPSSGQPNYKTNHFLSDLQGTQVGTSVCPERVINDPFPSAPDASSDGKVHGLRSCQDGDWLFQRDQDATFVWEDFGFYKAITPLVTAFANKGREDLFIALMEVLHKHWADDKGTPGECKLATGANGQVTNCTKDGAVSYEALLSEVFASDFMNALHDVTKLLTTIQVPTCAANDPKTNACTSPANVDALTVVTNAVIENIDPTKSKGLKDRKGNVTALRNDGTTNPQVTPLYLVLEALNSMDAQFAAYAAANPNDAGRQDQWKAARSQLVDQFLDIDGKNTTMAKFHNAAVAAVAPLLIDLLRAQLTANCPSSFVAPFNECKWATTDLPKKVENTVGGPTFAALMDLLDAVRQNDAARKELLSLLTYLLDAASNNDALAGLLASASDMVQVLRDDTNLVPLYKVLSQAAAASLVDPNGNVVQKSLVDANFALLARLSGRARDTNNTEVCSKELDPNQVMTVALGKLVTPMTGPDGKPTETPLEVIIDVIADVNRADPSAKDKLQSGDYANIADNVSDFLLNKERGLEQFYEVVRQGTVK